MKKIVSFIISTLFVLLLLPAFSKPVEADTPSYFKLEEGQYFSLYDTNMTKEDAITVGEALLLEDDSFYALIYATSNSINYSAITYNPGTTEWSDTSVTLDWVQKNTSTWDFYVIGSPKTAISAVVGASTNIATIPTFGGSITNPTITVSSGSPAFFNIDSSNGHWQKYNSSNSSWETVYTETQTTFDAGKYRYECQIRTESKAYCLSNNVNVTVNGVLSSLTDCVISDSYSYNWWTSPEYTISEATTYAITANNCSATVSGSAVTQAAEGTVVTITADDAPAGKTFDKWTITGANVANAKATSTTFTMGTSAVTVTATYKTIPESHEESKESSKVESKVESKIESESEPESTSEPVSEGDSEIESIVESESAVESVVESLVESIPESHAESIIESCHDFENPDIAIDPNPNTDPTSEIFWENILKIALPIVGGLAVVVIVLALIFKKKH